MSVAKSLMHKLIKGLSAITFQNFIEANVKNGVQFYVYHKFTAVPNEGGRVALRFVTPPKSDCFVSVKSRTIVTNSDNIEVYVMEGGTHTGTLGDKIVRNYNRLGIRNSKTDVYTCTSSTGGIEIDRDYIPGAVGVGNARSGQFTVLGVERILRPSTEYFLILENNGTGISNIFVSLTWYEGNLVPLFESEIVAES